MKKSRFVEKNKLDAKMRLDFLLGGAPTLPVCRIIGIHSQPVVKQRTPVLRRFAEMTELITEQSCWD